MSRLPDICWPSDVCWRVHRLKEEVERLSKIQGELEELLQATESERNAAHREIEQLRTKLDECYRLLQQYGGHKETCKSYRSVWWWSVPNKCDCGWQNEIATCYIDGRRK